MLYEVHTPQAPLRYTDALMHMALLLSFLQTHSILSRLDLIRFVVQRTVDVLCIHYSVIYSYIVISTFHFHPPNTWVTYANDDT